MSLSPKEQSDLRVAVDRDESGPGYYNDTRHLFAAVERIVARRDAARAVLNATETDDATITEWGVRQEGGGTGWAEGSLAHVGTDEAAARRILATRPGDELVTRRRRTRLLSTATTWEVVR